VAYTTSRRTRSHREAHLSCTTEAKDIYTHAEGWISSISNSIRSALLSFGNFQIRLDIRKNYYYYLISFDII
jgi:hypothetical protein